MKILAINPGSTSTKIALYEGETLLFQHSITHSNEELARYDSIGAQFPMRKDAVLAALIEAGYQPNELAAVVGRGGILPPVQSGAYLVDALLAEVLEHRPVLAHASNLGGLIARNIAEPLGIPAYIYDSVAVDELSDVARISGLKHIARKSLSHALNMRAVAIKTAQTLGKPYRETNQIIAHLGGGLSLSAHQQGKMVDIVSDDEGPFSPERSGRLPLKDFAPYAAGKDAKTLMKEIRGGAGLVSHLGTNSALEVEQRIAAGDAHARLVYEAMAYQIAKSIGELATVLCGAVDAITITGGIAHSRFITDEVIRRTRFIAPVYIAPGENEMEALALGAYRVLTGQEEAHRFVDPRDAV